MRAKPEQVARWSAAIREYDPLEPWLTESAQDQNYWDDVAELVVARLGPGRTRLTQSTSCDTRLP